MRKKKKGERWIRKKIKERTRKDKRAEKTIKMDKER